MSAIGNKQLSFLDDVKEERQIRLESTIDVLRQRFGHFSIQRAMLMADKPLTDLDPKNEYVIYPVARWDDVQPIDARRIAPNAL